MYGGTGPGHGTYKVQLDGQPEATLSGASPVVHVGALLYAASGLGPGGHRVTITNIQEGKVLDVDYAEIVPHSGTGERPYLGCRSRNCSWHRCWIDFPLSGRVVILYQTPTRNATILDRLGRRGRVRRLSCGADEAILSRTQSDDCGAV